MTPAPLPPVDESILTLYRARCELTTSCAEARDRVRRQLLRPHPTREDWERFARDVRMIADINEAMRAPWPARLWVAWAAWVGKMKLRQAAST